MPTKMTPLATYAVTLAGKIGQRREVAKADIELAIGSPLLHTVAGGNGAGLTSMSVEPALTGHLKAPWGLCAHRGKLYIGQKHSIAELDLLRKTLTVFLGKPGESDSAGNGLQQGHARVKLVSGMLVLNEELYFSDFDSHQVRKVGLPGSTRPGLVELVAGNGKSETTGDGGQASKAGVPSPVGLAVSTDGRMLYISSYGGHRIRAVDLKTQIIKSLAGTGEGRFSGDGGPAASACLKYPRGLLLRGHELFVADSENDRVRIINLLTQPPTISTFAGGVDARCDGMPAKGWRVARPAGLATGPNGYMYISCSGDHTVLAVDLKHEHHATIHYGGTGASGGEGKSLPFSAAPLHQPRGCAVVNDTLFICETENHRVCEVALLKRAPQQHLAASLRMLAFPTQLYRATFSITFMTCQLQESPLAIGVARAALEEEMQLENMKSDSAFTVKADKPGSLRCTISAGTCTCSPLVESSSSASWEIPPSSCSNSKQQSTSASQSDAGVSSEGGVHHNSEDSNKQGLDVHLWPEAQRANPLRINLQISANHRYVLPMDPPESAKMTWILSSLPHDGFRGGRCPPHGLTPRTAR